MIGSSLSDPRADDTPASCASHGHPDAPGGAQVVREAGLCPESRSEAEADGPANRLEAIEIRPVAGARVRSRLGERPPAAPRVDLELNELPRGKRPPAANAAMECDVLA